ncbi:MAG: hypothetical protein V4662_25370 [Verrucomicrobiota bacterium]
MFRSLFISLAVAASALAQSGLDNSLIFAGTTATSGGQAHAWLIWQPTDPLFVSSHTVALYRKNGGVASPAPYARVSIVEPTVDTRLIESMLPSAQALGQNMADLEALLKDMLGDAAPAAGVTIAQRLSALVAAAHGNAENMQRLILLGRQHVAVALALGIAVADPVPVGSIRTYELRDHDRATNTDIAVLGRVTLDTGSVLALPAPGRPFEIEDSSSKGNLNVSLRWATPNNLRDLTPLHYGYDVYRVPLAAATSHGWNAAPPATTALLVSEPQTSKVNRLAVLPPRMLTGPEADNLTDTETVFLIDDKDRFKTGITFNDGEAFMYFVVARDLLGRGGVPSNGRGVTVKDRMPTNPPVKVKVRSVAHYNGTTRDQRFVIEWQAPELPAGETISQWHVYRWRTPNEMTTKGLIIDPVQKLPDKNLIAILPVTQTSLTDDGSVTPPPWAEMDEPPPSVPDDTGKTYFYTVRAVDGSFSHNLSGHSSPAWGVLRDRAGPDGVDGGLTVHFGNPGLTFDSFTQVPLQGLTNDQGHIQLTCAGTPADSWEYAEFALGSQNPVPLGRATFKKSGAVTVAILPRTLPTFGGDTQFLCRVATKNGRLSSWVATTVGGSPAPQENRYLRVLWNAVVVQGTTYGGSVDWLHDAVDPLTGDTTDVSGKFTPSPGAKEYKVYRRVNGGLQTLVTSGAITSDPVDWVDPNPVASNCIVCYYLQLFDEHGNAGPLVQQGECLTYGDASYLPTPILEPMNATAGLPPRLRTTWFCNIAGVQRFELWVGRKSGTLPVSNGSGLSNDLISAHPNMLTSVEGAEGIDFAVFETGLARHLNATGSPEFSFTLPLSLTDTYTVMVRAVGEGKFGARMAGAFSNIETFSYAMHKVAVSPVVPWPDRPLPPKADFHSGVRAVHLNLAKLTPWKGNAVRIGEYEDFGQGTGVSSPDNDNPASLKIYILPSLKDLENYLYRNDGVALAEPLETIPGLILPVAMYRVQVPSAYYPSVPGDLVQVTPLMEKIAQYDQAGTTTVTDSFIALLASGDTGLPRTISGSDQDIFLLDRQPVLKQARYKYLLVRFGPDKEIERVIVTNEIEVP